MLAHKPALAFVESPIPMPSVRHCSTEYDSRVNLQVVPTNRLFFRYILLLGMMPLVTEIPLTLAWMKALHVTPASNLIGLAHGFWARYSLENISPEDEEKYGNLYARLVVWTKEWMGPHWELEHGIDYWVGEIRRICRELEP
jgi:hypothetical protein